jgi:hypothetical protein
MKNYCLKLVFAGLFIIGIAPNNSSIVQNSYAGGQHELTVEFDLSIGRTYCVCKSGTCSDAGFISFRRQCKKFSNSTASDTSCKLFGGGC